MSTLFHDWRANRAAAMRHFADWLRLLGQDRKTFGYLIAHISWCVFVFFAARYYIHPWKETTIDGKPAIIESRYGAFGLALLLALLFYCGYWFQILVFLDRKYRQISPETETWPPSRIGRLFMMNFYGLLPIVLACYAGTAVTSPRQGGGSGWKGSGVHAHAFHADGKLLMVVYVDRDYDSAVVNSAGGDCQVFARWSDGFTLETYVSPDGRLAKVNDRVFELRSGRVLAVRSLGAKGISWQIDSESANGGPLTDAEIESIYANDPFLKTFLTNIKQLPVRAN